MSTPAESFRLQVAAPRRAKLESLARKLVLGRLARLERGSLRLTVDGEELAFGAKAADGGPAAHVVIRDPAAFSDLAFGGSIGAAEAYMLGFWDTDDLTALIRVLLANRGVLDSLETGAARLAAPAQKLLHWLNRNTRAGSRRNIAAHYDLGNDFFELWLDPTLMYSSAIFERADMTLEEASTEKIDRICRKLALEPSDRVLEIGTGWGGFALHAARHYGCRIVSITISREQYERARERIAAAGLADRVDVQLLDYRDLDPTRHGRFDKLVSIEMIEAVGHEFQGELFAKCGEMLEPHGAMLLQAITIADQRYEQARKSVDFIQRYIFPGSCLTSVTTMSAMLTRRTDLRVFHLEDIGPHYATTLAHWRAAFNAKRAEMRALGYSEEFLRMWEYYLCYCEAGFIERAIGDVQMLLVKPECRRAPL